MKKKVLVCASTTRHINDFHIPYIDRLKKQGYEVKVMATADPGTHADFDVKFKKKIVSLNNFDLPKEISKILKQEKFDVVFTNTSLASFYVRLAIKKLKEKPIVINIVHGYFFDSHQNFIKNLAYRTAEKLVKNQTDYVVTMNEEDYSYAKNHNLSKKGVFKINGMGIDINRTNGKDCYLEPLSDEFEFTFVGEISERKNQKFLIKFIKKLDNLGIKGHLTLVGFGENLEKYKKFAKKLQIDDRIDFLGYREDISQQLSKTNFYISASKIEGLPFNILEVMQAGQIVISADTKGTVDLIKDMENGVLYKFNNMKDFIFKFRIIKNDIELQKKMRENAKNTAKKYTLDAVFEENIALFNKLIGD